MHTSGHLAGSGGRARRSPATALGGGQSWAAGPDDILLANLAGTKHERDRDTGEAAADGSCFQNLLLDKF